MQKDCFIEKWVYSNTPEPFVQAFMNDVTPQILPTPPARFTGLFHIPSMARRSGSQPNTP